MKLCINELLYAFSSALDAVEHELAGNSTLHAQRVAYIAAMMGRDLPQQERMALVAAGLLHDNALSEYIQSETIGGIKPDEVRMENKLGQHCAQGERNVKVLPFYEQIQGAVLYHHERADGTGPFGKRPEETPAFARWIHLADNADVRWDLSSMDEEKYKALVEGIRRRTGSTYDEETAERFLKALPYEKLTGITGQQVTAALFAELPRVENPLTSEEVLGFAGLFARIIDYKSPFTTNHSLGIAEKARRMGEYYGWDAETLDKLYIAGALHDVGKLLTPNDILEKPGRLTPEEYKEIQNHAIGTYVILNPIEGLEDITRWASRHHEKLDGSGYPFGLTGAELSHKERLMACLDIYQALVEARPYKDGMPHEKAIGILRELVEKGQLDGDITDDLDRCFGKAV